MSAQSHLKAMCLNLLKAANRLSVLLLPKRRLGCLIMGHLGEKTGIFGMKQPKTCVWVLAVGGEGEEGNFAKVFRVILSIRRAR